MLLSATLSLGILTRLLLLVFRLVFEEVLVDERTGLELSEGCFRIRFYWVLRHSDGTLAISNGTLFMTLCAPSPDHEIELQNQLVTTLHFANVKGSGRILEMKRENLGNVLSTFSTKISNSDPSLPTQHLIVAQ